MIISETLPSGLIHTRSDAGLRIRQIGTGNVFDDAIDSIPHTYEETDEPIPAYEVEATPEDYESALKRLGVET